MAVVMVAVKVVEGAMVPFANKMLMNTPGSNRSLGFWFCGNKTTNKIPGVFLFLFLFFITGVVSAQGPVEQASRKPPQHAIDVCAGKSVGIVCEVSTPEGIKSGNCAYTPDQRYFACRPERGSSDRRGPAEEGARERPDNPPKQQKNNDQQHQDRGQRSKSGGNPNQYTLEQAMSDNAQLSTIAFSGLAFITGSAGGDTFFPPGKVADFFGFQYMRDVDMAGYGHNTTFLTKVASNVLYLLNDAQKAQLVALAKEQAPIYTRFAYNRLLLSNAFRRSLEGKIPSGSTGLDIQAVSKYAAGLYKNDADLSYNRAIVIGKIINSFTSEQKAYLAKMQFNNYASWPEVAEDETLKRSMTNLEFVAVMTYASELFSWYKGGLEADVYFCPERHGTYFGGFFMKDYPAMHNPNYFISTAITGDSGKDFLNILNRNQRALITGIIDEQRSALEEIKQIRTKVSTELRKAITRGMIDKEKVYALIERYGELDGQVSALYASRFSEVNKTLTADQRAALVKLRNLDVVPEGAYRFSTPVAMPEIPNTDFMFGVGSAPQNAGQIKPPESFANAADSNKARGKNKQPKHRNN
jgi:hypothetical protein